MLLQIVVNKNKLKNESISRLNKAIKTIKTQIELINISNFEDYTTTLRNYGVVFNLIKFICNLKLKLL